MCPYDYTDAPPPRDLELIPHGTIATLVLHVRPGGVGEDGMLKRTRAGDAEMLDCELVVADGPHAKRKFWERWILNGTTAGQAQAAEIARSVLRAILERARPQTRRRVATSACRPHRQPRTVRGHDLHGQDRHREGPAQE